MLKVALRWALLVTLCVLLLLLMRLTIVSVFEGNTRYASAWSEPKFATITIGDSLESVLEKLGLPLSAGITFNLEPGGAPINLNPPTIEELRRYNGVPGSVLGLQYSGCENKHGDFYRKIYIGIHNGRVAQVLDEYYQEFW